METIYDEGPSEWSTDTLTDARSYLLNITPTEFICALVITKNILAYTKALTIIIIIIYSYSKHLKTNDTIKIYIYDKVVD